MSVLLTGLALSLWMETKHLQGEMRCGDCCLKVYTFLITTGEEEQLFVETQMRNSVVGVYCLLMPLLLR